MKEFQPGQAVACDVLTEPEGGYGKATASLENATPIGVIEANRVGAVAKKVKTKEAAPLVKSGALKSDRVMAIAAVKKVCHF